MADQKWDLEGFFLNGNSLSIVGGFSFDTGVIGNGKIWKSGDIFFDVNGTPQYGSDISGGFVNGNNIIPDTTYGYDFAIRLDFNDKTFGLYEATSNANTISSYSGTGHDVYARNWLNWPSWIWPKEIIQEIINICYVEETEPILVLSLFITKKSGNAHMGSKPASPLSILNPLKRYFISRPNMRI